MTDFLPYFFKVNVSLAVFYILFRVAFYRDTFWVGRRIYFIFAILVSALYPLISLSGWLESREPVQVFIAEMVEWTAMPEFVIFVESDTTHSNAFNWWNILTTIYLSVSAVFLLRFCGQLFSIWQWRRRSRKAVVYGTSVRMVSRDIPPFSFFKSIYLSPNSCDGNELKEVLAHEQTHVRQWHSVDVILGELLIIACWVNPFVWLLKTEIRQNLEFLTDSCVVKLGFNAKKYQYHLVTLALYSPNIEITNRFNVSSLKKRITMMNCKRTKKAGLLKYSLILPAAFALVLWANADVVKSSVVETIPSVSQAPIHNVSMTVEEQQTPPPPPPPPPPRWHVLQPVGTPITENSVWGFVEKMPEFSGGKESQMKFLADNFRYPVVTQQAGVQGRIEAQFNILQNGKISNAEIINGVSPELDREVLRVINAMPDWSPGVHKGKNVIVRQKMSVVFRLQGEGIEPFKTDEPSDIVVVAYGQNSSNRTSTAAPQIRITGDDKPLIIIDDEVKEADFDLSTIDVNKIYSFTVLKNESALSAYGEKGKNGVIVIILKQ